MGPVNGVGANPSSAVETLRDILNLLASTVTVRSAASPRSLRPRSDRLLGEGAQGMGWFVTQCQNMDSDRQRTQGVEREAQIRSDAGSVRRSSV